MNVPLSAFMPGVFDSLTHCMETYFGQGDNVSDRMNEGLMKDIIFNMRELCQGNDTLEVRSNLMRDSSLVQTFLFNVDKPGDFQAHQMENMLGSYSHGTHGKQLAVILPRYYRYLYEKAPQRFALFSRNVFDIREGGTDVEVADLGLKALEKLIMDADLPTTFQEIGYTLLDEAAKEVAMKCGISDQNQYLLTRDDIYQLLLQCR